jgi:hypothetical protein
LPNPTCSERFAFAAFGDKFFPQHQVTDRKIGYANAPADALLPCKHFFLIFFAAFVGWIFQYEQIPSVVSTPHSLGNARLLFKRQELFGAGLFLEVDFQ